MSTRVYGSNSAGLGLVANAWTTSGFTDWSAVCSSLVDDIQDGNDGCYVQRALNPSNHFCTYTIPDAAIPNEANVTLAQWGLRYRDFHFGGIPTLARPCIDTTQVSTSWISPGGFIWVTDTSKSQGLAQTGTVTKGQTWGFVSATSTGSVTVFISEFALKLTFTLPAPTNLTTNAATNVSANSATLNGTFNPNSATEVYPDAYFFQYGTTTAYGLNTTSVGNQTGTVDLNVSSPLTGLLPSTTYHFRLVIINADGTYTGADQTFFTTSNDPIIMVL